MLVGSAGVWIDSDCRFNFGLGRVGRGWLVAAAGQKNVGGNGQEEGEQIILFHQGHVSITDGVLEGR